MATQTINETNGWVFQWKIKNIPSLNISSTNHEMPTLIDAPKFIAANRKWSVKMYPYRLHGDDEYYVDLVLTSRGDTDYTDTRVHFALLFLDENGFILKEITETGYAFRHGTPYTFDKFLRLDKDEDKEVFLPNNTFNRTVQWTIWKNGVKPVNPLPIHAQTDCSNGSFRHELFESGPISPHHNQSCATSILADLKYMYKEEIFSDAKLRTSTQTFPVHKNILSARSPVFRRMFSSDMKEKNSGHIDITDLDEDTVHRMLVYIYTDTLEGLQFENACKLYVAGDKYEILSLRSRCISFLIANLSPAKAGDILFLADRHQDDELKTAVQDFIFKHDKEVFSSPEWKGFMGANIKLANEMLYEFALHKTGAKRGVSGHRFSPY